MIELGHFEINATHVVEVDAPTCELRVEISDPRDPANILKIEDARVFLVGPDGAPLTTKGITDLDGEASLLITNLVEGAVVVVEFGDQHFFDLDDQDLVDASDVQPLDTRPLLRLPRVWRSDEQAEILDDLGGRIQNGRLPQLEPGGQGSPEQPWVLRIDHAWTRTEVAFEFFDAVAGQLARVQRGLRVEAFDGMSFEDSTCLGGGTVVDDKGRHAVWLFRRTVSNTLVLRAECPEGTYVNLNDGTSTNLVIADGETPSLAERLQRYPLPPTWFSRGQFMSLDQGTTAKRFEEHAATLLDTNSQVVFDLDDVLLVNSDGHPIGIKSAIPVTLFGRDFVVKNPRSPDDQHSDIVIDGPHLRGRDAYHSGTTAADGSPRPHATTLVIRRGRKFYRIDGSRTATGEVVGVRQAIRSAHTKLQRPIKGIKGGHPCQAEIHLFDDVGIVDVSGTPHEVRVALVHASYKPRPLNLLKPLSAPDRSLILEAFAAAVTRWTGESLGTALEGKDPSAQQVFVVEPQRSRATKFVFHTYLVEEGLALMSLFLTRRDPDNSRGHAGVFEITLNLPDEFTPASKRERKPGDPVSLPYTPYEFATPLLELTFAHELGHNLGLPDEYLEKSKVELPQFFQPLRTILHSHESGSMMTSNFQPMLRHYWVFASYLERRNELDTGEYHLSCDTTNSGTADGRAHRYRHVGSSSPFEPIGKVELGPTQSRHTALIGYLGDDFDVVEGVSNADGVLVISPKIYVRMRGTDEPGSLLLVDKEFTRRVVFREMSGLLAGGPFVLRCTGDAAGNDLPRRILIRLEPRFSRVNVAAAQLRLHLLLPTKHKGRPPLTVKNDKVEILCEHPPPLVALGALGRHLLGLDATGPAGVINTLNPDELAEIAKLVSDELGQPYEVET